MEKLNGDPHSLLSPCKNAPVLRSPDASTSLSAPISLSAPTAAASARALNRRARSLQSLCYGSSTIASSPAPSPAPTACWSLHYLPEDVLRAIFRLLLEQDLCRVAQVCRRFRDLADDPELWRRLYKQVFQYDNLLIHPAKCVFEFVAPNDSDYGNPWKESFRQLYHGIHVRPDYKEIPLAGRNIKYFETVQEALVFVKHNTTKSEVVGHHALVFIHAGIYYGGIIIDSNVALLGAASENVMESVILESKCISTVKIEAGASVAYVGYLTIHFSPERSLSIVQGECSCLLVTEYCSPTVENCLIRSTSLYGSAVHVCGRNANPTIKFCQISESKCRGLCVDNNGLGTYENNKINRNRLTGVWVKGKANPVFQQNIVYDGQEVGIMVSGKALGCFQANDVFNNRVAAFEVTDGGTPVVMDNDFGSGEVSCVYVHHGGSGVFVNNKICSRNSSGVCILNSDPTFRKNNIHNCKEGVYIAASGRSMIEENEIVGCALSGIRIINSDPIVRQNRIRQGNLIGIYVSDGSKGCIHNNEIYSNVFHGIRVESSSTTSIRLNRIYSGRIGVYFQNGGGGDLAYNVIFSNEYANVKIATGSNPHVRRNKITNGQNGGVLISNGGFGVLEENEISDNDVANVWIKNFSNPTIKRNKIFDGKGCGIIVHNNGKGLIEQNQIFNNLESAVYICLQSHPILRDNRIFYGLGPGVEISYNATATLEYNQIFNNQFAGLSLASDVRPTMTGDLICNNDNAVEKAVGDNKCLFTISRARKVLHDFFTCHTCATVDPNRVCVSCVRKCHSGHEVAYVRKDKFFCSCGQGALRSQCTLLGESPPPASFSSCGAARVGN